VSVSEQSRSKAVDSLSSRTLNFPISSFGRYFHFSSRPALWPTWKREGNWSIPPSLDVGMSDKGQAIKETPNVKFKTPNVKVMLRYYSFLSKTIAPPYFYIGNSAFYILHLPPLTLECPTKNVGPFQVFSRLLRPQRLSRIHYCCPVSLEANGYKGYQN
jgi:hypothetical protein